MEGFLREESPRLLRVGGALWIAASLKAKSSPGKSHGDCFLDNHFGSVLNTPHEPISQALNPFSAVAMPTGRRTG